MSCIQCEARPWSASSAFSGLSWSFHGIPNPRSRIRQSAGPIKGLHIAETCAAVLQCRATLHAAPDELSLAFPLWGHRHSNFLIFPDFILILYFSLGIFSLFYFSALSRRLAAAFSPGVLASLTWIRSGTPESSHPPDLPDPFWNRPKSKSQPHFFCPFAMVLLLLPTTY